MGKQENVTEDRQQHDRRDKSREDETAAAAVRQAGEMMLNVDKMLEFVFGAREEKCESRTETGNK